MSGQFSNAVVSTARVCHFVGVNMQCIVLGREGRDDGRSEGRREGGKAYNHKHNLLSCFLLQCTHVQCMYVCGISVLELHVYSLTTDKIRSKLLSKVRTKDATFFQSCMFVFLMHFA